MTPSTKLVLAPLRGITDSIFRTVHADVFGGFDYAVAPFITTVNAEKIASSHIRDILPENNLSMPIVPQMIGNNPAHLGTLADRCADLGYSTVDWNLGCPFVKITRKFRGSGLIGKLAIAHACLDILCAKQRPAISIKVRLGMVQKDEYLPLLRLCNQYPLASVCIHPRTAAQMYSGKVDLDAFEQGLSVCAHPVIYNGDIAGVEDFDSLNERFGTRVSQWMIGRGAIADPLLPARIRDRTVPLCPAASQKIWLFHERLYAAVTKRLHGPAHILGRMKELWRLLGPSLDPHGTYLRRILKATRLDNYRVQVENLLGAAGRTDR